MLADGIQHEVFLAEIGTSQSGNMGVDVETIEIKRHGGHVHRGTLRVGGELQQAKLFNDPALRHCITKPQSGR